MLLYLWQGRKVLKFAAGSAGRIQLSVVWEHVATSAAVCDGDAVMKIQFYK